MSNVSDRDIARAQALGRAAARAQRPTTTNPYGRDQRVLRMRWVMAYAGAGGRAGIEGPARRAAAKARAWWSGGADARP